mmetsp:Transcript_49118/g.159170  ORF Transcript_49118/g.159170 Transcript_49118/m.159170 type:complete len:110 (+) Transcript_49118:80-409(+)
MSCVRDGFCVQCLPLDVARHAPVQRRLGCADGDAFSVGEDGGLNGRAMRHRLLRRYRAIGLLAAEVIAEQAANGGDARGATDEYNLVDLRCRHPGAGQDLRHRSHRPLE